jgi:hypothetical protein
MTDDSHLITAGIDVIFSEPGACLGREGTRLGGIRAGSHCLMSSGEK